MYCFFCSEYSESVRSYYYKWSPYHINACTKCDEKYRENGIKICHQCVISELTPDIEFVKDRGKTHYCRNCARHLSTSKCLVCSKRFDYNLSNFIGKYPICSTCCSCHGYWNSSVSEVKSETFDILPFSRRFGVELEGFECAYYKNLDRLWSCVHEGTETVCREFTSPPLSGDAGVKALQVICDYAKQHNWKVNERCGMHIHVDVGDLSEEQLVSVLAGYNYSYPYWCNMVTANRVHNRFCRSYDIYVGDDLSKNPKRLPLSAFGLRYYWVSFESLLRHNTIEIRNHEGTFHFNKIFYWVLAHLTFVEWCSKQSVELIRDHFKTAKQIGFDDIMGKKITRYYKNKKGTQRPSSAVVVQPDDIDRQRQALRASLQTATNNWITNARTYTTTSPIWQNTSSTSTDSNSVTF